VCDQRQERDEHKTVREAKGGAINQNTT
jgi:hypothetical protein